MLFKTHIVKFLTGLGRKNGHMNPDLSNTGAFLGNIYLWEEATSYCKARAESAWKNLEAEKDLYDFTKDEKRIKGDYTLMTSTKFTLNLKMSAPRKTFKAEAVIEYLTEKKKWKLTDAQALVEACTTEGKPSKTYTIIEKVEEGVHE